MKRILIFKVVKKSGAMPNVSYKTVFEREVVVEDETAKVWFHITDIVQTLNLIFPEHLVLVVCDFYEVQK